MEHFHVKVAIENGSVGGNFKILILLRSKTKRFREEKFYVLYQGRSNYTLSLVKILDGGSHDLVELT